MDCQNSSVTAIYEFQLIVWALIFRGLDPSTHKNDVKMILRVKNHEILTRRKIRYTQRLKQHNAWSDNNTH